MLKNPFFVVLITFLVYSLSLMLLKVLLIDSPVAAAFPLKSVSSYFFLIETPDYFKKFPTAYNASGSGFGLFCSSFFE